MLATEKYQQIADWFHGNLGQSITQAEKAELSKVIGNYFGYHLVQLGFLGSLAWSDGSPIQHRVWCTPWRRHDVLGSSIHCDLAELPFAPNSVDLFVLPHVLEFETQPQDILEQVCYTLIPEGHLIILGFNPYSLWGAKNWLHRGKNQPYQGNYISVSKIRKWLRLNNCTIDQYKTLCFQLPIENEGARRQLQFVESIGQTCTPTNGGVYCLVARKRIATVTPIRMPWRLRQIPLGKKHIGEPTTRG